VFGGTGEEKLAVPLILTLPEEKVQQSFYFSWQVLTSATVSLFFYVPALETDSHDLAWVGGCGSFFYVARTQSYDARDRSLRAGSLSRVGLRAPEGDGCSGSHQIGPGAE
jgi:hypothetical protein